VSSIAEPRPVPPSAHCDPAEPARAAAGGRDVHLYYALNTDIGERTLAALPRADRDRVPRAARAPRRAAHLAGRALLRAALEDATGRAGAELEIRTTPRGKPECSGGPNVSVSHSGPWAVCALSAAGRVGVDVQVPVPGRRIESIARQYFGRGESDWVATQPKPRFYMLWVLKEAYLKALGLGLAGGLDTLHCRIAPPVIEAITATASAAVSLRLYRLETAFVGIASVDGGCGDVGCKRWYPERETRWLPGRLELVAATAA
jgi:4'-phosphopantetheinyl transferase